MNQPRQVFNSSKESPLSVSVVNLDMCRVTSPQPPPGIPLVISIICYSQLVTFHIRVLSSHRMHLLISFRESTPPQNRQLIVDYY